MANLYWYGGTGNWSNYASHWSNNSGNSPSSPASAAPTSSDNAIFDANSGSGTVTIDVTSYCLDLDFSSSSLLTIAGSSTLYVYGSFTLKAGITYDYTGNIYFQSSSTGKTITTAGVTVKSDLYFNGSGGEWTLQDNLTLYSSRYITHNYGSIDFNDKNVSISHYYSANTSTTKALDLGNGTITLGVGSASLGFDIRNGTNYTLTCGTSTISFTNTANRVLLATAGKTFYNVTETTTGGLITGAGTFNNLTLTGQNSVINEWTLNSDITVNGTFTISGPNANSYRARFLSNSFGSTRTITANATSLTNIDFQDITGAGSATWTGTCVGDMLGNSNITFTTPVTRYWVGDGGSWDDTAHWSNISNGSSGYTSPLPQDTVYFDAYSFTTSGQTVTTNSSLGKDVSFAGVTNNPTLNLATTVVKRVFGDFILDPNMTTTGTGTLRFEARSSVNINCEGITVTSQTYFYGINGSTTFTLTGNFVGNVSNGATLSGGTLDFNGYDVTALKFTVNSGTTLYLGEGTTTLTGTSTIWTASGTINCETSTISITDTSATSKTFYGGGQSYNIVDVSGDNITITNSSAFATLAVNTAGLTNGLKIGSGTVQTVGDITTNGSSGSLAKISSSSDGSYHTFSKSDGIISVDYMSIKDSHTTGGSLWFAGAHSDSVSGNSGWLFTGIALNNSVRASIGGGAFYSFVKANIVLKNRTDNNTSRADIKVFNITKNNLPKASILHAGQQFQSATANITLVGVTNITRSKANITYRNVTKVSSVKASFYDIYRNSAKTDILATTSLNSLVKAFIYNHWTIESSVKTYIRGTVDRKTYDYRVYDDNTYVTTWSEEVISDPTFRAVVNGGPGEMIVKLARKFDDFGEEVDVKLFNTVEVWCFDKEAPNGVLVYSGFVSGYRPIIDGHTEYVEITLLHQIARMSQIMLRDGVGDTQIAMNSYDPSQMFREIVDYYRADGGVINYTDSSVINSNELASYTFNLYTTKEALDKVIELAPENWFWRIDADNIATMSYYNIAKADHALLIGKNVSYLETWRRAEDMINRVYFVGQEDGAGVPRYYVYSRDSSVAAYGVHAAKYIDQRVSLTSTAGLMSGITLDRKSDPEIRTVLTITDSNGHESEKGYDIESIKPGQSIQIRNLKQPEKTVTRWDQGTWDQDVWDETLAYEAASILQVVSIEYSPTQIRIEASSKMPEVSKRMEEIYRNWELSATWNVPATPS